MTPRGQRFVYHDDLKWLNSKSPLKKQQLDDIIIRVFSAVLKTQKRFRPLKRIFVHLRAISSTWKFCIKMVREAQLPKTLYL